MRRHVLLFLLLFALQYLALGQGKKVVAAFNPTGTYKLNNKSYIRDGDTYGYFGSIRIKLISLDKIAVSLYVCKGAPSYDLGSFVDAIPYRHYQAVYHHAEGDTSCRITFHFSPKGVTVNQVQANLNCGCGFGFAVLADGYYRKVSGKIPVIKDEAKDD